MQNRSRTRFGPRPDAYVQGDLKKKGMFEARNPANAHLLLPNGCKACPDYVFKGRECAAQRDEPCSLGKKHYYSPNQLTNKELEDVGDSFLANGDVFLPPTASSAAPWHQNTSPLCNPTTTVRKEHHACSNSSVAFVVAILPSLHCI